MDIVELRKELVKKQEESKQLLVSINETENLIYDLMNKSTPSDIYTEEYYQMLINEDTLLRQILSIDQNTDICHAFNRLVRRRMHEIEKRRTQSNEARHQLHTIKKEMKDLTCSLPKYKPAELKQYMKGTKLKFKIELHGFREYVEKLKTDFQQEFGKAKEQFKKEFLEQKEKAVETVKILKEDEERMKKEIELKKEQRDKLIAEVSELPNHEKSPEPVEVETDPEKMRSKVIDYFITKQRTLKRVENSLKKVSIGSDLISAINAKIDQFESKIQIVIEKVQTATAILERNRAIEEKKRQKKRIYQARANFTSLLRIGRLGMTVQKISNRLEPWFETQTKVMKEMIAKEKQDVEKPFEDTNMSIPELRKEIIRLEKLEYETSLKRDQELKSIRAEKDKLLSRMKK